MFRKTLGVISLILLASPALAAFSREPVQSTETRKALPTCAEFLEMDQELRYTGIAMVLRHNLVDPSIPIESKVCMERHVPKIDMVTRNICTGEEGVAWEDALVRAVARFASHCDLAVE